MISFRHHVVSLVAVFLALAVGVALGGGPLADTGSDGSSSSSGSSGSTGSSGGNASGNGPGDSSSSGSQDTSTGAAAAAYAERFAATAGARLYADGLASSPVAVIAMPGADKDILKSLSTQIQAAGGRVTGRYGVKAALVDSEQRSLVDSLGSQLITQLASPALDGSASTYDRIGQLLGVAVATTDKSLVPADTTALQVRESFTGAGLVASPTVGVANAPLVLVLLGPEDEKVAGVATAQASLLSGLAATAGGVVVLGGEASAESGTLAELRGQTTPGVLATVDGADSELGQVGSVMALIGVLAGRAGAFGAASSDGALPLG